MKHNAAALAALFLPIRRAVTVAALTLTALLALTAAIAAIHIATAPRAQSISVPPTIEAEVRAEEAEFQQWAVLRAAWTDSQTVSRYDEDHPDVAYRADLVDALAGLPAWVSESLPPVSAWPKLRDQLAQQASTEKRAALREYETTIEEWSRVLGRDIDVWGGWGEDPEPAYPIVPAYPHGWWESDRLPDNRHIDALWAVVQAAGETPQARAEFIRQAYGPFSSVPLGEDYVQVVTAPFPTGTVVVLSLTAGVLAAVTVTGATLLYRRREGVGA